MAWYNKFIKKKESITDPTTAEEREIVITKGDSENSYFNGDSYGGFFSSENGTAFNPIYSDFYDGEKTPGELGSVLYTYPDHLKLRLRAYDSNLKTDIIKIITGKYFKAVIGSGLKLQSEPVQEVLKINGIDIDLTDFKKKIESCFNLYANSYYSDYRRMQTLHENANDSFSDSFLGGDNLFILRADDKGVNIQVIDGEQIQQPDETHDVLKQKKKGNIVVDGVEIDKKGTHIAYYVIIRKMDSETSDFDINFKRVDCKDNQGRTVSRLVYGSKHRINDVRGISRISSILEKVNKLDRYTEATVSKMEESANVVLSIEHDQNSTGENPLTPGTARVKPNNKSIDNLYEQGQKTAAMIEQSTSKKTYNMPNGAKLKGFESGSDSSEYETFSKTVFMYLCASVEIPVEVALQMYNSNYSASRAAINAWEHIAEIVRKKFSKDFYQPFYNMYLEYMILSGKIDAPGYIDALENDDFMVIEAYCNARWVGPKTPHIDPLKEVKAVELMLSLRLISREQAAEMLNLGNWEDSYDKFVEEGRIILKEEPETINNNENNNGTNDNIENNNKE